MDGNTYPAEAHLLPQKRLWYGFSAAPVAWALQEYISVVVSAQACPAGVPGWQIMQLPGWRLGLAIVSLCLLIVALSGGLAAFMNWHQIHGQRDFAHAEVTNREAFMSLGGMAISAVFTLGILWAALPTILLQVCERGR